MFYLKIILTITYSSFHLNTPNTGHTVNMYKYTTFLNTKHYLYHYLIVFRAVWHSFVDKIVPQWAGVLNIDQSHSVVHSLTALLYGGLNTKSSIIDIKKETDRTFWHQPLNFYKWTEFCWKDCCMIMRLSNTGSTVIIYNSTADPTRSN